MEFGQPVKEMSKIEQLRWTLEHTDGLSPEAYAMFEDIIEYLEEKESK
tara:strand:+ start:98 stop:241 length:144 start_codon:yes stop_codon:yes gene_type:complete